MVKPRASASRERVRRRTDSAQQKLATLFRALDRLMLEGITKGRFKNVPREELHSVLLFALSESARRGASDAATDWVRDAALVFLGCVQIAGSGLSRPSV